MLTTPYVYVAFVVFLSFSQPLLYLIFRTANIQQGLLFFFTDEENKFHMVVQGHPAVK